MVSRAARERGFERMVKTTTHRTSDEYSHEMVNPDPMSATFEKKRVPWTCSCAVTGLHLRDGFSRVKAMVRERLGILSRRS